MRKSMVISDGKITLHGPAVNRSFLPWTCVVRSSSNAGHVGHLACLLACAVLFHSRHVECCTWTATYTISRPQQCSDSVRRCCLRFCCSSGRGCVSLLIAIYVYCGRLIFHNKSIVQARRALRCPSVHVQTTTTTPTPEARLSTPRLFLHVLGRAGGKGVCDVVQLHHEGPRDGWVEGRDNLTSAYLAGHGCEPSLFLFLLPSPADQDHESNRLSPPPAPGYISPFTSPITSPMGYPHATATFFQSLTGNLPYTTCTHLHV